MPLGRYRKKRGEDQSQTPTSNSSRVIPPNEETTVMVRNIPTRLTSLSLIEALREHGFDKTFDFIYSPIDFKTKKNVGYAFINFISPDYKTKFIATFQGLQLKANTSQKCLDIISSRRQGFLENISVFGASELLSSTNQLSHYKPMVMIDGDLVPLTDDLFTMFIGKEQHVDIRLPAPQIKAGGVE